MDFLGGWVVLGACLDTALLSGRRFFGDHEVNDGLVERLVVCAYELDQDLVRPWREAVYGDGLAAGIQPAPGCIVDEDMDVADARRHIDGIRTEHRYDPQVLGPILDDDPAVRQGLSQGRIDDDFRRGLVCDRCYRSWPAHLPGSLSPGGAR